MIAFRHLVKGMVLGFLLCISMSLLGQGNKSERAEIFFREGAWHQAVPFYESWLKKNRDREAMKNLADCYRFMGKYEKAFKWYEAAVYASEPMPDPEALFHYAALLKRAGNFEKAAEYFRRYGEAVNDYEAGGWMADACIHPESLAIDSGRTRVMELRYEAGRSDISPQIAGGSFIFASAKTAYGFSDPESFVEKPVTYDLYEAAIPTGVGLAEIRPLRGEVNSSFHESSCALSPDGQTLYFTRSNFDGKQLHVDLKGMSRLKIYTSKKSGADWIDVKQLDINGENVSTCHPALSPDGETMFFSSDREGGLGGMDLWVVYQEEGTWTIPENLGPTINTPGNEIFPYYPEEGKLYFSSDGFPGYGGLDIFSTSLASGEWQLPKNAGKPLNSQADDFGIWIDLKKSEGYFSTGRNPIGDRLYHFEMRQPIVVQVKDSFFQTPLKGVEISVVEENGRTEKYVTNEEGKISFSTRSGKNVKLILKKGNFQECKAELKASNPMAGITDSLFLNMKADRKGTISGVVKDEKTNRPIPNALIEIYRQDSKELSLKTDADGRYSIQVEPSQNHDVIITHPEYVSGFRRVSPEELENREGFMQTSYLQKGNHLLVEGVAVAFDNGMAMAGVKLKIFDNTTNLVVAEAISGPDGRFWAPLKIDKIPDYSVLAYHNGYFASRIDIEEDVKSGRKRAVVLMRLSEAKVNSVVKVIFYDYDAYNLNNLSKRDLNEIYFFLKENSGSVVEMGTHTDCRGTHEYNLELSERRAQSVVDFIIRNRDVDPSRIVWKGYGEGQLVNDCHDDNPNCTEEQHSQNRRAEVKVVRLNENSQGLNGR